MADAPEYLRVIRTAALNGAFTAVWVAAGELPTGKRRVARTAVAATATAVGWAAIPLEERPFTWSRENGFVMPEMDEPAEKPERANEMSPARSAALVLGMVALSAGVMLGGRKMEKRWLAGLQRAGHPHPYRGLAWRMAALHAAGTLPADLLKLWSVRERR